VQWGRGGRACSEAGPAAPSAASTAASSAAPAEAAAAAAAAPAEAAAAAAVPAAVPAAAATAAAAAAAPAAATATTKAAPTLAAAAAPALAAAAMAFATTAMAFAALAAAAALATAVRRGEDLLWRRRRWLAPLVLVDAPLLALDRAVVVGAPVPLGDARRGAAVPRWRLRAGCCGHVRVTPLGTVAVALVRHLLALALQFLPPSFTCFLSLPAAARAACCCCSGAAPAPIAMVTWASCAAARLRCASRSAAPDKPAHLECSYTHGTRNTNTNNITIPGRTDTEPHKHRLDKQQATHPASCRLTLPPLNRLAAPGRAGKPPTNRRLTHHPPNPCLSVC
jgi:hypothetical protein